MTKNEYIAKYNKSFDYAGLHCAMIFHYDPILEVVECRSIYSEARIEVVLWIEQEMKNYRSNKIHATAYIDGIYEEGIGDITHYIKEEEV